MRASQVVLYHTDEPGRTEQWALEGLSMSTPRLWNWDGRKSEHYLKFVPAPAGKKVKGKSSARKHVRVSIVPHGKKIADTLRIETDKAREIARKEVEDRKTAHEFCVRNKAPAYGHKDWKPGMMNPVDEGESGEGAVDSVLSMSVLSEEQILENLGRAIEKETNL